MAEQLPAGLTWHWFLFFELTSGLSDQLMYSFYTDSYREGEAAEQCVCESLVDNFRLLSCGIEVVLPCVPVFQSDCTILDHWPYSIIYL